MLVCHACGCAGQSKKTYAKDLKGYDVNSFVEHPIWKVRFWSSDLADFLKQVLISACCSAESHRFCNVVQHCLFGCSLYTYFEDVWHARKSPRLLVVPYELLLSDFRVQLRRIAAYVSWISALLCSSCKDVDGFFFI